MNISLASSLLAAALLAVSSSTSAQAPASAPQSVNAAANDSVNKFWLAEHGRRTEGRLVVVLAPRDSITEQHQRALTDSIDRGMAEVARLTGGRQPQWQSRGERRTTYYLSPGTFVAHATIDGEVFISIQRSLNGRAPYLHEGAHTLLIPNVPDTAYVETAEQRAARMQRQPLWLMEGFADVLALRASAGTGVPEVDLFGVGGLTKADSACASRSAVSPHKDDVLSVVGTAGVLQLLFTTARPMKAGGRSSNGSWVSPQRSSNAAGCCASSSDRLLSHPIGTKAVSPARPEGYRS